MASLAGRAMMAHSDRHGLRGGQQQGGQNKSKRLYVGNIPYHVGIGENGIVQLFSALYVAGFGPLAPGEPLPVSSFWLHGDGKFGFMELRGDPEAVDCMQFNGLVLHGRPLRVNRPSDYRPELHGGSHIAPSPINLPAVMELCKQLGGIVAPPAHLAASAAALGPGPGVSANGGGAAVEHGGSYSAADVSQASGAKLAAPSAYASNPASSSLRSMPQGAGAEASDDVSPSAFKRPRTSSPGAAPPPPPRLENKPSPPTREPAGGAPPPGGDSDISVISLRHLVSNEDLDGSAEQYEDLVLDVKEECSQYGTVLDLSIPRSGRGRGAAYIAFSSRSEAEKAIATLKERVFNGQSIEALLVPGVRSADEAVRAL